MLWQKLHRFDSTPRPTRVKTLKERPGAHLRDLPGHELTRTPIRRELEIKTSSLWGRQTRFIIKTPENLISRVRPSDYFVKIIIHSNRHLSIFSFSIFLGAAPRLAYITRESSGICACTLILSFEFRVII